MSARPFRRTRRRFLQYAGAGSYLAGITAPQAFAAAKAKAPNESIYAELRVRTLRPVAEVRIPARDGRPLAALHREGEVIDQRSEDSMLLLHVRATEALIGRLKRGGATVS